MLLAARCLLVVCSLLSVAAARAETLESVLSQMDAAAAQFQTLTAHVRSVKYTAIVSDTTVDEGTIWVKKLKPHVSQMLIEFTLPDKYYVEIGRASCRERV